MMSGASTQSAQRVVPLDAWVRVGLVFLGAGHMLPPLLAFDNPLVSGHTIVATLVGWVGWRSRTPSPVVRAYMVWAVALSIPLLLSSVSVWDLEAMRWSVTNGVWLIFIVPGV